MLQADAGKKRQQVINSIRPLSRVNINISMHFEIAILNNKVEK